MLLLDLQRTWICRCRILRCLACNDFVSNSSDKLGEKHHSFTAAFYFVILHKVTSKTQRSLITGNGFSFGAKGVMERERESFMNESKNASDLRSTNTLLSHSSNHKYGFVKAESTYITTLNERKNHKLKLR